MMPLVPWRDALRCVLETVQPSTIVTAPVEVRTLGSVLAQDVQAHWDFPSADVSVMDGYAARAGDLIGPRAVLSRVGESAAGHPLRVALAVGETARISTGAVLPSGADLVIPQEDVEASGDVVTVDLAAFGEVKPGRWVRRQGSELTQRDVVLEAGRRLGAADLAVAASTGNTNVRVHARPRVAIVSTGDELVPRGTIPPVGKVVSSNDLLLAAAVVQAGGIPIDCGIAPDDPVGLRAALAKAMTHDFVVTSGGISVGDHDLVARTFAELGIDWAVHGILLRPGKPLAFGSGRGTHVFGLPGNPASSWVTFCLFVAPAIRRHLGVRGDLLPPTAAVELRNEAPGAGRRAHLVRAELHADGTATALSNQSSGDVRSMGGADALLEVPAGTAALRAGSSTRAFLLNPWRC
ncbi:MAG: molybdopterin molybdotransferase MoeA [Nannocystaceae bacterium]|nr:molybdopterin molybdotransferase MoeA [Nannocystaceae bacterium]